MVVGGVVVKRGHYLISGATQTIRQKPADNTGYAFFDGRTLTLHSYQYNGNGIMIDDTSFGICVPGGELTVSMEGDSSIVIDAITRGVGIYVVEGATVIISGKGSLTISVQNGKTGNFGIFGEGRVKIKSGTLRISAGLADYIVENDKKRYKGNSYAINIKEFIDRGAHASGNDRRGSCVNKNNPAQVVYDFPRHIPLPMLCLGIVALIAIGVTVWAMFFRAPVVLTPDYAPVDAEKYAEEMANETDTDKMGHTEGGGAMNVTYQKEITISRSSEMMTLYFANPSRSNNDMVLQLVIQGEIIAQSGTLHPGHEVRRLALLEGMGKKLARGGYDGIIRVLAYQPGSGEKAILNTDLEVDITVK